MELTNKERVYHLSSSVVFRKTTERWGGLSNMAKGYPICINGISIQSSEILYQAMRFTGRKDIQREIVNQSNPMYAKRISRKYTDYTRSEWDRERIAIMKWCICVKLCLNWDKFSTLLISTGDNPIVEYSDKDQFWGAKSIGNHSFRGVNALGRILMQVRDVCKTENAVNKFLVIPPPKIDDFLFLGEQVQPVLMPQQQVSTGSSQLSLM
ncbi:NADAR family protein [Plesiomonas shigelloides]|uniref:NADAR family protein n=1 Tax=Plesiomonas shigelloides TaxID=703 RepID=UPI00387F143B